MFEMAERDSSLVAEFRNPRRALKHALKTALMRWPCPAGSDDAAAIAKLASLRPLVAGKTIALVGNAQSLFDAEFGAEIEAAGIVARLNFGGVRSEIHQGKRTNILFFATKMKRATAIRLFGCRRFVWGSPKRMFIDYRFLLHPGEIAFVPFADADLLAERLGARPSTGLVALHLLLNRLGAGEVRLYGFDWKRTRTFYEDGILRNVHDWEAEAALVQEWAQSMPDRLIIRCPDRFQPAPPSSAVPQPG
jgi:hypothetical protein